jgi:ArsR family transcriptional regulator, virulence genes transcriptional regulator
MQTNNQLFMYDEDIKSVVRYLKSMAHPSRLQVLLHLKNGEASVNELETLVGISQSNMSQHLGQMRRAGLLKARRDGAQVFYSLQDPRILSLISNLIDNQQDESFEENVNVTSMGMQSGNVYSTRQA